MIDRNEAEDPQAEPTSPSEAARSRRTLLQDAGALAASTTLIGGLMSAYGLGGQAQAAAAPAAAGGFDPKKYAGTQLSILMTGDENDHRALGDLLPELEAETGIKLEITSPALAPLIEKTLQNLKADRSSFDLIMYIGFLTTQQVGAGYFERLNPYMDNPAETPPDWDFADFLPPAVRNVGFYDRGNRKLGQGPDIYGVPGLHSGSVIYFYRKDLFDAAGLQPAKTWEELQACAEKLHTDEVAGYSFIGANDFSLAVVDWYTRFITIGGKLMSGDPNGKDFRPNIDTPEGVRALQLLIDMLPFAPKNVTTYGFAENVDGFSSGKIAQLILWVAIAGPVFNPDTSIVADKIGTAAVPADPGQTPRAVQGGWGLGIPANADPAKKAAAWRALTWMTSKRMNRYSVEEYQMDANRVSTFKDPELVAQFPYLPDALRAAETAETIPTSLIDEFFQLNDIMNVEFNKALIGGQDAKSACRNVQQQWEAVLRKAGRLA